MADYVCYISLSNEFRTTFKNLSVNLKGVSRIPTKIKMDSLATIVNGS